MRWWLVARGMGGERKSGWGWKWEKRKENNNKNNKIKRDEIVADERYGRREKEWVGWLGSRKREEREKKNKKYNIIIIK